MIIGQVFFDGWSDEPDFSSILIHNYLSALPGFLVVFSLIELQPPFRQHKIRMIQLLLANRDDDGFILLKITCVCSRTTFEEGDAILRKLRIEVDPSDDDRFGEDYEFIFLVLCDHY